MVNLGLFLQKRIKGSKNYFIVFLMFGPKVIFLLIFFIDVVIIQQFNYISKIGIILLIPLIINYILYALCKFSLENLALLDEILQFYHVKIYKQIDTKYFLFAYLEMKNQQDFYENNVNCSLNKDYISEHARDKEFSQKATFDYYFAMLNDIFVPIGAFSLLAHEYYKNRLLPYANLIINFMYLLLWMYILIYSLKKITITLIKFLTSSLQKKFQGGYIKKSKKLKKY